MSSRLNAQTPRVDVHTQLQQIIRGLKGEVALAHVRNDVGPVFTKKGTHAVAIFTWDSADTRWTADNAVTLTVARITKALFDHFESGK